MREFIRALRPDTLLVSDHARQQRDRRVFPGRAAGAHHQGDRPGDRLPHRRDADGGQVPIDLDGEFQHVDLLSFSGHKLHAPKGVGALFVRRGTPCRPFMIGGHQEERPPRRAPRTCRTSSAWPRPWSWRPRHYEDEETRIRGLRDRLERVARSANPQRSRSTARAARGCPTRSNVSCHYIEGEGMLYQLSEVGICASSGSACTSGSLEPSHVLRAMNVPFTAVHGSIRFSFSRYNTDEDVDRIIEVFPQIVANLRRLSPYWDQARDRPRES